MGIYFPVFDLWKMWIANMKHASELSIGAMTKKGCSPALNISCMAPRRKKPTSQINAHV